MTSPRDVPPGLLEGDVALVTGAARGIGRAIACGFAKAGAAIAVTDVDVSGAAAVAAQITRAGGRAVALSLDVADRESCRAALANVETTLGAVSVLVNNAGLLASGALGSSGFFDDWRRIMQVNLDGCMYVTDAALAQLRRTRGRIVNVCSTSAILASDDGAAYAASKAAVLQLTRACAVELGRDDIRVNALAPGMIRTDIGGGALAPSSAEPRYVARTPLGRIGEPDDLVGPALFLASSLSAHVTGVLLPVDGGYLVTSQRRSTTA